MSGRVVDRGVGELLALPHSVVAVAAVLVFYTYADSYGFALGGPKPVLWVAAFAALAAALVVVDPRRPLPALRSPLVAWMLFYLALTLAWIPSLRGYEEAWQVLDDRSRSLVTLLALLLIFDHPRARRSALLAVAGCVVLASALNVAELLSLATFTAGPERSAGRASGLHFNANGAALAIASGVAVATEELPRRWRMPLVLVSVVGVAATFSRSGVLCLALAFAGLVWRGALGRWPVALGAGVGAWLLTTAAEFAASSGLLNANTAARLHLEADDSARIRLALKAWRMFLDAPWLGNGLAATRVWDADSYAHNLYVTLGAEQGLLGLLTLPALAAALHAGNRRATCFALVLLAGGFFSHGLLESRVDLVLVALAAVAPTPVEPTPSSAGEAPSRRAPSAAGA